MIDHRFGVTLGPLSLIEPDLLYKWRNNPKIYKWCRQYEPLEKWEHEAWLKSLPARGDISMYSIIGTDKFIPIGVCGLTSIDHINRHAEFSLYIGSEYQGSGLGEKALKTLVKHGFDVLNLNHIFGETFEGNSAALTFKKVGFKHEGTRRGYYYRDGQYIDAHIYSILKDEASKW